MVLYFFPAAFSEGCSIEAHQFAEAIGKYEALGASVIGVSGDDLELITRFSVQVCQGKFPVAADEKKAVIKAFDAAMQTRPEYANRVSYVIAPNGKVVYSYLSLNPNKHVERTLAAVAQWAKDNPRRELRYDCDKLLMFTSRKHRSRDRGAWPWRRVHLRRHSLPPAAVPASP